MKKLVAVSGFVISVAVIWTAVQSVRQSSDNGEPARKPGAAIPLAAAVSPEPASRQFASQGLASRPCEQSWTGSKGQVFHLASPVEEAVLGQESLHGQDVRQCVWKVGQLTFAGGRRVVVFLQSTWRGPEPSHRLILVRDGSVRMGSVDIDDPNVRIDGNALKLDGPEYAGAALPVLADGPPWRFTVGNARMAFETDAGDLSDVAYARALREPPGSQRGGCALKGLQEAPDAIRRLLARDRVLSPGHIDGANCLWRVGVVTAEGGKRYGLYIHNWEGLASRRWNSSLLVLENDRQFVGGYYHIEPQRMEVRGADLLVHGHVPGERIRFGPHGPPARIPINGDWREYIPGAKRSAAEP